MPTNKYCPFKEEKEVKYKMGVEDHVCTGKEPRPCTEHCALYDERLEMCSIKNIGVQLGDLVAASRMKV